MRILCRLIVAGLLAGVTLRAASPVRAQPADEPADAATHATLPQSNEAMLLASRVEQATQRGEYRLAIELATRMLREPGELVALPAGRTFYPVWRQVNHLLEQFPPAGAALYQQLFDAEVAARLAQARATGDLETLRALFRTHRLSTHWPQVGRELATRLIERGAVGEAIDVLSALLGASPRPDPRDQAQLVIALTLSGARDAAGRLLERIRQAPAPAGRGDWPERLDQISAWVAQRGATTTSSAASPLQPALEAGERWSQPLEPAVASELDGPDELAVAIDYLRHYGLHNAVIADDTLLVRLRGSLFALDPLTLTTRWRMAELGASPRGEYQATSGRIADDAELSESSQLLLFHYLRHTLSAGAGLVFTVEDLSYSDSDNDRFGGALRGGGPPATNELVARSITNGAIIWRSSDSELATLNDVAFLDAPRFSGDKLLAVYQRGSDLKLGDLDAHSGRLNREVTIVGPPTYFTPSGGRCLLTADASGVYVCTGNGVIAAFEPDTLAWKWAAVYPSTLADHLGRMFLQPLSDAPDPPVDRPVIVDDLLVIAPVDTTELLAIDRFSGLTRWRVDRGQVVDVVGHGPRGLIVSGERVECLDPADGRTLRWRSVPLSITGRAAIADGRVFVPTRDGVVVLDAVSGKVTREPDSVAPPGAMPAGGAAVANLVVAPNALYALRPERVEEYPDIARTRAVCEQRLAAHADDAIAQLCLAQLDVLAGRDGEALARLEQVNVRDDAQRQMRDRLLADVFLALGRSSDVSEEKLAWLRKASALTSEEGGDVRMAALVGGAFERAGRWRDALDHYGRALLRDGEGLLDDPEHDGVLISGWLYAVRRIRVALERATPGDASAWLTTQIAAADAKHDAAALMRLREIAAGRPEAEAVTAALLGCQLAPEQWWRILPPLNDVPADDPAMVLRRWEVTVALDQPVSAELYTRAVAIAADSGAGGDADARRLARIARGVVIAQQKLAALPTTPYAPPLTRQWAIEGELIRDLQHVPGSGHDQRWTLTRSGDGGTDGGQARIVLLNLLKGDLQRSTPDALLEREPARRSPVIAMFGGNLRWNEPQRLTWPAARDGMLAAVPVENGLVCVGLGPERDGGGRLWQAPVHDWDRLPGDLGDKLDANERGVYYAAKRNRVTARDWFAGDLRWEHELGSATVRRIRSAGDTLLVFTDDGRIFALDAAYGTRLATFPTGSFARARGADVIGDVLVVWGEDFVAGLDARSFDVRWQEQVDAAFCAAVPEKGWLLHRGADQSVYTLRDGRSGQVLHQIDLGWPADITAAHVEGDLLYVAARLRSEFLPVERLAIQLCAFDLAHDRLEWNTTIPTLVDVNVTQLASHPDYIPVLLLDSGDRRRDEPDIGTLALQLVDKRDGQRLEPEPISRHFRATAAGCYVYVLATPTRIIVQAAGNLVAFGNSPLGSRP